MKKFCALFLSAALLLATAVGAWAAYYDDNSGDSEADAYIIDSMEDLKLLRDRIEGKVEPDGKYYKLTKNIDMTSEALFSIGSSGYFTGHLDGQNHTIQCDGTLFHFIKMASASDIAIKNLNVEDKGESAGDPISSGLVTYLISGVIQNCSFSGTVTAFTNREGISEVHAGGVVGEVDKDGEVVHCTFQGTVQGKNRDVVTEITTVQVYTGGIVGRLKGGKVINCSVSSTSIVSATASENCSYAGGIVGHMDSGYIFDCTSNATITGDVKGGIVGRMESYDINRSNVSNNTYITLYPEVGWPDEKTDDSPTSNKDSGDIIVPGSGTLTTPSTSYGGNGSSSLSNMPAPLSRHVQRITSSLGFSSKGETLRYVIPVSVDVTGRYSIPQTLGAETIVGDALHCYVTEMTETDGGVSGDNTPIAALKPAYTFVSVAADDDEKTFMVSSKNEETTNVPEDKQVYVSAYLQAKTNYVIMLTTSSPTPVATIELVVLSDDMIEKIANQIEDVDSVDIRLLTSKDVLPAQEPTDGMKKRVSEEGYEITYKLDTISVDVTGYYIFKINVPDEYVGLTSKDVQVVAMRRRDFDDNGVTKARAAVLPGIVNGLGTLFDFDMFGLRIDTLEKQIIVVGLFQAGEPFSVYLLKILLVLLGGCDGFGLGVLSFAVVGGVLMVRRWRKR